MAQYRGANLVADPPTHRFAHLSKHIEPSAVQTLVADYLERSKSDPSLHPDALLTSAGVKYGPQGGPTGGITIHYLRRVESGLRGETLAAESKEDLAAQFGDDAVMGRLPRGDDSRVDATIHAEEERANSDKKSRKRKREEEIEAWASRSASEAGVPDINDDPDWQTKAEFEQEQEDVEGEVGEREAGPAVKQNGRPPIVAQHGEDGAVRPPKKVKTDRDKAARKAEKKARRLEEKKAKASRG